MSARRFVSRMRGLGLQRAPVSATAEAGDSSVSGADPSIRTVSARDFTRALTNPRGFFGG